MWFLIIISLIIIAILLYFFFQVKKLKIPNVFLVTGGVKVGKSFTCVWLVNSLYNQVILKYLIVCAFKVLFHKPLDLPPVIYSNMPLGNVKYNELTLDVVKREVRIPNKSIVFIDEASLLADSMAYKDDLLNEQVSLFVKLFGHYSHGGYLILNTQSIQDLHYAFKRCINNYLYIHSKRKLPFFTLLKVRELQYSDDDSSVMNVFNEDIEETLKTLIVPNKYYKFYDYCYLSSFTDYKKYRVNYNTRALLKKDSKKATKLISFRTFRTLEKEGALIGIKKDT